MALKFTGIQPLPAVEVELAPIPRPVLVTRVPVAATNHALQSLTLAHVPVVVGVLKELEGVSPKTYYAPEIYNVAYEAME